MSGHWRIKKIEVENLKIISGMGIAKTLICLRNYQL